MGVQGLNDEIITTKHIIDGVTYTVNSTASEKATETLHRKIEKLLLRDMRNINNTPINDT